MIDPRVLFEFAKESNKIEGITDLKRQHIHANAIEQLLSLDRVLCTADVDEFVYAIQPNAEFRLFPGMDVRVGHHMPIRGGKTVQSIMCMVLSAISRNDNSAHQNHIAYESLHPYTDGNGRSGRALWLWQMHKYEGYKGELLFLHKWYYQTLQESNCDGK
jgi:hypothetical protein